MEKVTLMSAAVISLFFVLGVLSTHIENRRRDAATKPHRMPSAALRSAPVKEESLAGMMPTIANRIGSSTQHRDEQATQVGAIGG